MHSINWFISRAFIRMRASIAIVLSITAILAGVGVARVSEVQRLALSTSATLALKAIMLYRLTRHCFGYRIFILRHAKY